MTHSDRPNASPSVLERIQRWTRPAPGVAEGEGRSARARREARARDVVLSGPDARPDVGTRLATWLRTLDRRARLIGAASVLCVVTMWCTLGVVLNASHHQQWDDASAYADNIAKLLAADLETNFALCDQSLQALMSNISNPALMGLPPALRYQAMFNSSFNLPIFGSLVVTDKDGIIREHANAPVTRRIDVADRDYFKVQRDRRDAGIFVDHPFISRITGEWMVVVSRRIDVDGRFDGVVAGGLKLEFLKRLLSKVRLPAGSTLVLRYEDGTVMMSNAPGALAWTPAFIKRVAASEEASLATDPSDGVQRLVMERKVSGLPLYESVSLPVAVLMQPYWRRARLASAVLLLNTIIIFALGVTLLRELSRRNAAEVLLQRLATIDGLTGLRNRRCFDEMLEIEVRRGARGGRPLALLMIDVDHFKAYNDSYGHSAGDAALRAVAAILSGEPLRSSDIVARVGGEEFAVLAADTDLAGGARLAERIRCAVRERRLPHVGSRMGLVTVSIGVACLRDEGAADAASAGASTDWAKSLFDEADAALYRAKRGGRDRAEVSPSRIGRLVAEGEDRLTA